MVRKHLAAPAYAVAALLVLFPLLDTALSVLPPRPGEVAWRFGAAGLFSRAVMTPLLGLLLAFAVALLLEQRRALRLIAVVSGLTAALLATALGLFLLDSLQMRSQVAADAKSTFDVATVVAIGKYGVGVVLLALFSAKGWRASANRTAHAGAEKRRSTTGLVLGQPPT